MKKQIALISVFWCLQVYAQNACIQFEQKEILPELFDSCIRQHRNNYKLDFLIEERSPITKADTGFLRFFEPDSDWWLEAEYEIIEQADFIDFATSSGKIKKYRPYAILHFKKGNEQFNLTAYQSEQLIYNPAYADYLFLPFTDLSNGDETYGGGRYLDLRTGNFMYGKVWVDFNKAYNPYCAYSGGYSCPVPPKDNRLKIIISAGEKNFAGKKHE
jgi:uncharacterized protein (DUF1684 family)